MSYDLTFFKYSKKPRMAAGKIYASLMDGQEVSGLEPVPEAEVRSDFKECFADWKVTDGAVSDFEKDNISFQLSFGPSHTRVDFYGDYINYRSTIHDIRTLLSGKYGMHMYDAQQDVLREVIGQKTAYDRACEIRRLLAERMAKTGYVDGKRETEDAVLRMWFQVYEQNKKDVVTVRPYFDMKYPALDRLAYEIRGKAWEGTSKYDVALACSFAITDASDKAIKDPCYGLKNGEDPTALAEQVWGDIEKYVLPIFDRADTISKYEEVYLDKSVKAVRPNVYQRPYYEMAFAILNRGTLEEKKLVKLLQKAEKEDSGFDASAGDRVRKILAEKR